MSERGPFAPLALRRLHGNESQAIGLTKDRTMLARIGGNASFVAAARKALQALGDATPCDEAVWARYRAVHQDDSVTGFAHALADPLSRRVRQQFDPRRVLNPGILGEAAA